MKFLFLLVLTTSIMVSGCATLHEPVKSSESVTIETTVSEKVQDELETSGTNTINSPIMREWVQTQYSAAMKNPFRNGFFAGLTIVSILLLLSFFAGVTS